MKNILKSSYRAELLSIPDGIPVSVRSVGHYTVGTPWQDKSGIKKNFIELFWCLEGEGAFVIEGREYSLKSGFVTYYYPMEEHIIRAASEKWSYRWVTFDGPLALKLFNGFNYQRKPFFAGPCPEDLFIKLEDGISEIDTNTQRISGASLYAVLAMAAGQKTEGSHNAGITKRFIEFVKDNYDNETINVNSAADILKIHRSTLNRAFTTEMKMTPSDYIANMRIQKALSMLRETELPVCEIGNAVGISDKCYFSKVIKKATGMNPVKFRRQF